MIYFETDRLRFRDWQQNDFVSFKKMNADREVMRYFPSTLTADESAEFLKKIKDEFKERGYSLYAVELKDTGEFIGYIGFHLSTFEADFTPCVEIGWRLHKNFWGRGYATEGAQACLRYGFDVLGLEEVYSFTATINTPSENVMKRIGLKYVGDFEHPKVGDAELLPHVLYLMKKDEFYHNAL
jgi:ribosomal-protein-alanine N-acetyltransferase